VSSNLDQGGVQHYVIKFVSDLRQVEGFLRVIRFPPPIKLTATLERNKTSLSRKIQKQNKNKTNENKENNTKTETTK
jgi:hypothetical protein